MPPGVCGALYLKMLVAACVAVALVWLLVVAASSDRSSNGSERRVSSGECRVSRFLATLPSDYKTVNDIMLPTVDGATTQVDHAVVSRYGIFVIETKDYSGWIFGGENQRTWTQSFSGGRWSGTRKFHFQNPIRQNWRHVYTMADRLELPLRYFHNVVAFCGEGAFMTRMPENVMRDEELCSYIRSFSMPVLSISKVEQLVAKIATIDAGISEEARRAHVSRLHANHDSVLMSVACARGELRCPKCGARMVLRHRKADGASFYGCSRYPQCHGIRRS